MSSIARATQTVQPNTVLPGDRGRHKSICYDPASQYYYKVKKTPRDVMDPTLKQQYLTDLFAPSNSTAVQGSANVGDSIYKKDSNSIRLVTQNIGCLGVKSFANGKQAKGIQWLIQHKVDIVAWQELGVSFHMQQRCDHMKERIRDPRWSKVRLTSANNRHESIDLKQFGGTCMMTFNSIASRVSGSGCDETGLGRWCWLLFEGKRNVKTRIFSVYVPNKSQRMASVYQQQKRYFLQNNLDVCPRKKLIQDLVKDITRCQSRNERIVICTDANENLLNQGPFVQAMKVKCGLQEVLRSLHPHIIPPNTNQMGSKPIDGIFVSPILNRASRGGWLEFGAGIGDHRPVFVDINIRRLLGEDRFTIQRPYARRLKCDDPRIVNNYNRLFEATGHKKGIFTQYAEVQRNFQAPLPSNVRSQLFQLDSNVTASMLSAEGKCRKLRMGNVAYTADSAKMREVIELWNNVIRKKEGSNISSTHINRMAKKCNIVGAMDLSIEDCIQERKLMYQKLYDFAKTDKQSRKEFIDSLADAIAADGDEKKSSIIRRLNRTEEDRIARRNIKVTVKPFIGATSKIQMDDSLTGESYFVTDKGEIEQALRNENAVKYTLAYSSPFLQEPLLSLLGQNSLTVAGDEILAGTFEPPPELSVHTKKFIKLLKMHDSIKYDGCNSDHISLSQSSQYWSRKPEKTSSSMSGRHIGTYKASRKAAPLFEIITGIMNMAYKGGVSLPRWERTLDVSLLKKPGRIRPSDLRTIGQLEADFNQGASLHFSRRMMNRAMALHLIPESQYAKKGSQCIDAALVKILFFEHLRLRRINGTFMTKDLMQCFDRMAHPVAALCTRRLGVPPMVVKSMVSSLTRMKHFLRTAYGDSAISYGGDLRKPLQGAIQGNGAAAQIFVAISCLMIAFLESECIGFHIRTSLSLTLISFIVVMYVDDADIMISASTITETIASLLQRTQHAADTWRIGAAQTGAALRPHKCKWYLIAFRWKNNQHNFHTCTTAPAAIYQKDTNNVSRIVERLEPHQSVEGLGIHFNPKGCWKAQYQVTQEKLNKWCNIIRASSLNAHEVYLDTTTGITRSVSYVLPATSFDKKQCNALDSRLFSTVLPRLHINRHLPKVYRHAPQSCHGLNFPQTVISQYIAKTKKLLYHANQQSQLGLSMISILETLHLSMGVETHIFKLDYSQFQFLMEPCWFKDIWRVSSKYNIIIEGTYTRPQCQRHLDVALMEVIVRSGLFTNREMILINRIRIYLQVFYLSDITSVCGQFVKANMYKVRLAEGVPRSKWHWPEQVLSKRVGLRLWQRALREVCGVNGDSLQLTNPLGPWLRTPHTSTGWYLSPCGDHLYQQHSLTSYIHHTVASRCTSSRKIFTAQFHSTALPVGCKEVTVCFLTTTKIYVTGTLTIQPISSHSTTFVHDKICTSHPTLHSVLRFSSFPGNGRAVATSIKNGTAIAVTDASIYSSTIGTAAWVIQCPASGSRCLGRVRVPIGSSDMNSYRAEIFGIYSILLATKELCSFYSISSGRMIIACDNDDGLLHSLIYERRIPVRFKSIDFLWAIHRLLEILPVQITPEKVKGHTERLSREKTFTESLNVEMDEYAKAFGRYVASNNIPAPTLHDDNNWYIQIGCQRITENIDGAICDHIHRAALFQHLVKKQYMSRAAISLVDWKAIGKANKNLVRSRYLWTVKFAARFLPTANHMSRSKAWDSNLCPLCKVEIEDNAHLMHCTCPLAKMERHAKIYGLHEWMTQQNTAPDIILTISYTLINGKDTSFVEMLPLNASAVVRKAAMEQDAIGWDNFCVGRISLTWALAQQQYHSMHASNPNPMHGHCWASRLISKIYDVVHDVWAYRNSVVHEHVEEKLNQRELNDLHQRIDNLYNLGPTYVRAQHRYLFNEGIDITKQRKVRQKKYWVRTLQVSMEYHKYMEENMYVGMRSLMLQWARPPD